MCLLMQSAFLEITFKCKIR